MKGMIVISGRAYLITRMELRGGMLHITASGTGPCPEARDEPVTVFGSDGRGICQGWRISVPEVAAGENVVIILPLRIASVETVPGETEVTRA